MTDQHEIIEPVDVAALFEEYSDHSVAELMLTIRELKGNLEQEKKAHAYDELKLRQAEEKITLLEGRINAAIPVLHGEADICIDCGAVKEQQEDDE